MSAPLGEPSAARRRLLADSVGIAASAVAFGIVFGLAARSAGYSSIEAIATSLIVFSGASQFAAVGLIVAGVGWPIIVLTTLLLNVRMLMYAAALRTSLASRSVPERAAMAHVLTDEAFALASVHFRRLGRPDAGGYWLAAIAAVFIPWNAGTAIGILGGSAVPDPTTLGLDVVFPAAMAGIAVALITSRREAVAAVAAVVAAVSVGLVIDPRVGIVAGGVLGPLIALVLPVGGTPPGATALPTEPVP